MALKLAEEQALREEEEAKEEEANNPMKLLENRTQQSKNEIELLESLEELKDLNRRQQAVDYDSMLLQFDTKMTEREREEKLKELDEQYIKTINFKSSSKRKVVVEEIIEEIDLKEPAVKSLKVNESSTTVDSNADSVNTNNISYASTSTTSMSLHKDSSVSLHKDSSVKMNSVEEENIKTPAVKPSVFKGNQHKIGVTSSSMKSILKNAIRRNDDKSAKVESKQSEVVGTSKNESQEKKTESDCKNSDKTVPKVSSGLSLLASYSGSETESD